MKKFFLAALVVYFLDRISKIWILHTFGLPRDIFPLFTLVKVWNPGVAFGVGSALFFKAKGAIIYFTIALLFLVLFTAVKTRSSLEKVFLGIIFGGGLGNLTDRLLYGRVLDFLDFHIKTFHWPAFNVADAAISSGIFFYVLNLLRKEKRCT